MVEKSSIKKIVLAYSGGLDTSVIVPWLSENYGCEVVCFTADVGQGEEMDGLEAKAIASGASQLIIHDMREEFARDYIFPVLRAGAVYERKYLLGTSMARPLIAKHQVEVAHQVGADAVAHGATGKGNDQVRFELTYTALDPRLKVIAPWREWTIRSREDAIAYARAHNVPITQTEKSIYSRDRNLWHLSHEGGLLEDPWLEPDEAMYQMSVSPETAPDQPEMVEIDFETGTPVAINGQKLSPAAIVTTLERARRDAWHRPDGHGRRPAGGDEIPRRVRDPRRHHPARRPPGAGIHRAGPRHDALQRPGGAEIRRAGL